MRPGKFSGQKSARERRLYFQQLQPLAPMNYELSSQDSEFHYLVNVLRVQPGQVLALFDGAGLTAQAVVTAIAKKTMNIHVETCEQMLPTDLQLHLILGVSKGDRMDYALQKSTELGVTCVTPLWSERSEVRLKAERLDKKMLHWQGVIRSACEQSYQNFCPVLHPAIAVEHLVFDTNDDALVFVCDPNGQPMSNYASGQNKNLRVNPTKIQFLVGPEGGWSEAEIATFRNKGALPLSLGPRILRTETAPVVMLTLAQSLWGDFAGKTSLKNSFEVIP